MVHKRGTQEIISSATVFINSLYTKAQLSFQLQQKVVLDQMDHAVVCVHKYFIYYTLVVRLASCVAAGNVISRMNASRSEYRVTALISFHDVPFYMNSRGGVR